MLSPLLSQKQKLCRNSSSYFSSVHVNYVEAKQIKLLLNHQCDIYFIWDMGFVGIPLYPACYRGILLHLSPR